MFKEDLQQYNQLFDQKQKIDFEIAKECENESRPLLDRAKEISDEADKEIEELVNYAKKLKKFANNLLDYPDDFELEVRALQALTDDDEDDDNDEDDDGKDVSNAEQDEKEPSRGSLKITAEKWEKSFSTKSWKETAVKELGEAKKRASDLSKYCSTDIVNRFDKALDDYQASLQRTKYPPCILRGRSHPIISFVPSGFIAFVGLCLFINPGYAMPSIIAGVILFVLGLAWVVVALLDRFLFSNKRKSALKPGKENFEAACNDFVISVKDSLSSEREKLITKFSKIRDDYKREFKSVCDKYERIFAEETKDIQKEIDEKYHSIDNAISNLMKCFPNIGYSVDYMRIYANNSYTEFDDEKEFLSATREIIAKKEEEDRRKQKEAEEREEAERRAREEAREKEIERQRATKAENEAREQGYELCRHCANMACKNRYHLRGSVCSMYKSK